MLKETLRAQTAGAAPRARTNDPFGSVRAKPEPRSNLRGNPGLTISVDKQVVKAKLVESKVSAHPDFFTLSDGFKGLFANDKKDRKMIIPVVGYGGHRKGDRSANFFGKSFRETTLQSKCLERQMRR